jgi:hypothetical protein
MAVGAGAITRIFVGVAPVALLLAMARHVPRSPSAKLPAKASPDVSERGGVVPVNRVDHGFSFPNLRV